jgi:(p)ppGpp synthase/HD superfamily hydrolase
MTTIPKSTLKRLKNMSHREYMYSDFDRDGAKNIDDPKPFDKHVSKYPAHKGGHYHKARYGGGDTKLSTELLAIERYNNRQSPMLRGFLQRNPNAFGRIKTVPSTMKKLRERYHGELGDIAGATLLTYDRQEAYSKGRKIVKRYKIDPTKTDDYYKHPKGPHYALHYGLVKGKDKRMELQITSKRMYKISQRAHARYKKGQTSFKDEAEARTVFGQGG